MKRSGALKIIVNELNKNFYESNTVCPTSAIYAGIAHDILYHLEQLGMQPPLVETEIRYTEGGAVKLVSRWEEE